MNRFSYERAASVDAAVVLLAANPGARIIAGGSNLIDLVKYNVEKPESLIDITRIKGLSNISGTPGGGLRVEGDRHSGHSSGRGIVVIEWTRRVDSASDFGFG